MERIYHRYEFWECYKNGFYNNKTKYNNDELYDLVIEFFNNTIIVDLYMNKVINEWIYSCEHNLTNISLNRVAWLGQAACCIYKNIPYKNTMDTWKYIDKNKQIIACEIAEKIIKKYEINLNNKQLCLKFI